MRSGCYLLQDGDGEVQGLWFEDIAAGDFCTADPRRINAVLVQNDLGTLMNAAYFAGPDGDRGGPAGEWPPAVVLPSGLVG